jgi:hypothetical protein
MPALNIKTRAQFVTDEVAAIQAALPGTFLFPPGSIVRALTDGHSATAIWLQANQQYLYNRERLATSTGLDVDTFIADFGLTRLPGVASSGEVQFASFTPTIQRVILLDATVSTQDGSVSFKITEDDENPYWNASAGGYIIPPGIGTVGSPVSLPVEATVEGIIGNVNVNTITVINSPITGIDTVNNAIAFANGQDEQTDAQVRTYFVDYLNSLSKATVSAISFAIESYQEGVEFVLVENENYDTNEPELGYFYAVVDDGSGDPQPSFLAGIQNAVEAVRGLTIRFDIKAPIIVDAVITATVIRPSSYSNPGLAGLIETALTDYVDTIPFGGTLYYSRISQVIYNVIQSVAPTIIDQFNVTAVLLNGGTSNLVATFKEGLRTVTPPVITIIT